jgi:hypothetical protein
MPAENSEGRDPVDEKLVRQIVERLASEKLQRTQGTSTLTVLDVGAISQAPANRGLWVPGNESAFSLYLSRRGSPILDELRTALSDRDAASSLEARLKAQFEGRAEMPLEDAARIVLDSNVFGALEYAGQTLVDHLTVPPDLDLITLVWPYSGGKINPDAFVLTEWRKPGTDDALEALVVYRHLPATTAEDLAESTIGREPQLAAFWCLRNGNATMVGATYVGATAAAAWVAAFMGPVPGARDLAELGDDVVEDVSPDELIDLRRRALSLDIDPS